MNVAAQKIESYIKVLMLERGFSQVQVSLKQLTQTILKSEFSAAEIEELIYYKYGLLPFDLSMPYCFFKPNELNGGFDIIKCLGRPYQFQALEFLHPIELISFKLSHQAENLGQQPPFFL